MKLSRAFWLLLGAVAGCQVVLDLSERHAADGAGGAAGDASTNETGSGGGAGGETSVGDEPLFALRFGDAEYQHVDGLVTDAEGDLLLFGRFAGQLDFGAGISLTSKDGVIQAFFARFHSDGSIDWAKLAGDANITSAAIATERTIVAGTFGGELDFGDVKTVAEDQPDSFVAMFEDTGSTKVVRTYPGGVAEPQLVALGELDVVLTGRFRELIDFAGPTTPLTAAGTDSYVAKLDLTGIGVWARAFPECPNLAPRAIARAANGTLALAAEFSEGCKLDQTVLAEPPGLTTTDCLIATLDGETGKVNAAVRLGGPHCDASSIAFTSDFGVALLGSLLGTPTEYDGLEGSDQDVFALALSADLSNAKLAARLPRAGVDTSTTLAVDVQDRLFTGGTFPSGTLVAQLSLDGSAWTKEFDSPTPFENSYVVTDLASVTIAGTLSTSADFGNGVVTSAGNGDVFLVKYAAPP